MQEVNNLPQQPIANNLANNAGNINTGSGNLIDKSIRTGNIGEVDGLVAVGNNIRQIINNFAGIGLDAMSDDDRLKLYLARVYQNCNRVSLTDLNTAAARTASSMQLDQLFTTLRVSGTGAQHTEDQTNQQNLPTAIAVIDRELRLLLLGEPGSGKSTLLAYIAAILAAFYPKYPAATALPDWSWGAFIPIRVRLRFVAEATQRANPNVISYLWDGVTELDLDQWLSGTEQQRLTERERMIRILSTALNDGKAILLLDGWDAVDDRDMQQTRAVIQAVLANQRWLNCPLVITCRTLEYYQHPELQFNLPTFALVPLDTDAIKSFVHKWYRLRVMQYAIPSEQAEPLANKLVDLICANPGVLDMSGNPLLLTMIVSIQANNEQQALPTSQSLLYEEFIKLLLLHWNPSAERPDLLDRLSQLSPAESQIADADILKIVSLIGFEAHRTAVSRHQSGSAELREFWIWHLLRKQFLNYDPNDPEAAEQRAACVKAALCISNRLLRKERIEQRDDTVEEYIFTFRHRSLQEYLAARYLAEQPIKQYRRLCQEALEFEGWHSALSMMVDYQTQQQRNAGIEKALMMVRWAYDRSSKKVELAILAGEILSQIGEKSLRECDDSVYSSELRSDYEGLCPAVQNILVQHVSNPTVSLSNRIRAANALCFFNDPRYPVELSQWQQETRKRNESFGNPAGYWCYVPGGTYRIGGWELNEAEAVVTLPHYWIARLPVVAKQYNALSIYNDDIGWTPEGVKWKREYANKAVEVISKSNAPVNVVSWYEATAWAARLNEQLQAMDVLPPGYIVRLCTEAEWEVAASYDGSGTRRAYPWGNDAPTHDQTLFIAPVDGLVSAGVCPAGASACGALDMLSQTMEMMASDAIKYPRESQRYTSDMAPDQPVAMRNYQADFQASPPFSCGSRTAGEYYAGDRLVRVGFRVVLAQREIP